MNNLKNKIINAINKGLNEALSDSDMNLDNINHKDTITNDSIINKAKNVKYQMLLDKIKTKSSYKRITPAEYKQLSDSDLIAVYAVENDKFKDFVRYVVNILGEDANLNWIDTSNVRDMSDLFKDLEFNGNISEWDVSNVETMNSIFANTPFNGDLSKWDTSKVYYMSGMFTRSDFNNDSICNWNVSNAKYMYGMFANSKFNQPISGWDVSNVSDMSYMFSNGTNNMFDDPRSSMLNPFNQDISNWNTQSLESAECMFKNSEFDGDISKWDFSKYKKEISYVIRTSKLANKYHVGFVKNN